MNNVNINPIIPEVDLNLDTIFEIRDMIKDFFSRIKKFILNLTNTNNVNIDKWNDDIITFSYSLLEISNSLMKLKLPKEQDALIFIRIMSCDILKSPELFKKYSYFITELLDLFADLISHLGDNNYNQYFESFSNEFNDYKNFYFDNICHISEESKERVVAFNNAMWGSN